MAKWKKLFSYLNDIGRDWGKGEVMKIFYENNSERFLFQVLDDFTFPAHLHGGLELFLVQKGEMEITVGNTSRILGEGELSIVFPNRIHSYDTVRAAGVSKGTLILCPAAMGGDFMSVLMANHPAVPFLTGGMHPDIAYGIGSLLKTRPDIADDIPVISAYIQLILARALPALKLVKNRDSNSPDITAQLVTYLSENYTEQVTLDSLAKRFGISRYSISRIFSEKLHTSFSGYLNTLRIDYAKLLLQGSGHDILTISLMCGYENSRTFNREFKLLCGCQPREYRKKRLHLHQNNNLPVG